jgi:hypothetical protein
MNLTKKELPLVILTGHRKSGTSVFHRLFDGVSGVDLYPTDLTVLYAYFSCFTSKKGVTNDELKERLMHVVKNSMEYSVKQGLDLTSKNNFLNVFESEIQQIDIRSKSDVIYTICNSWLKSKGVASEAGYFVVKETSQSVFFEDYIKEFPQLKMISLIRDPRDNYAAISAGIDQYYSKFGEGSLGSLSSHINRARMDLISAKINQENYPNSFMAIRFEDLVRDTKTTMKNVSNFLNIDFEESMLTPDISGKSYKGNNFEGISFSGISNQNIGKWKARITVESAKIIEYWMADVMDYWNYDLEFSQICSQAEFLKFYEKYNCEYFYNDSFSK